MMNFKKPIALLGATLILFSGYSQKNTNFKSVEQRIENAVPKSQLSTKKGWKYEHRWLDEMKKRVAPNGDFYDGAVFYDEAKRVTALKKKQANSKAPGWIPVGPTQRASSSLTKAMGRINCIAFHPTNANTWWVGVAQGGVWKTTDAGLNWTPLTDDLPILRISDIAVDPTNPNNIYICVGDYAYMDVALNLDDRKRHSHYGMGVYKTTDGGTNWTPTGLTYQTTQLDGSLMRRVIINPNYPDSLVAAGISGIWSSADGGGTWLQREDSLMWDIESDPNNPYTLFATSGYLKNSQQGTASILKSTDFGNSWTTLNTGIPPTGAALRIEVAVAPTNSNHIYALACNFDKGLYGVYSSLDGGANWNFSNAGGLNILEWYDGFNTGGQGTYDLSLLIDPTDENTIYTGGVNIWGSSDGGATFDGVSLWYDFAGPGTGLHADQHQFKYNPLDSKFYVCNDGGLVRTSNIQIGSWFDANNTPGYVWPTNWEYMSDGMQTSSFYRVGVSEANSGNFSAGAQDNSTYFNNGGSWSNLFGGDGMNTVLHPTNANVIYGSSQYGRIMYSSNGGGNSNQMNKPGSEDGEWVTPFMLEPGNNNNLYAGFGNLYSAAPGNNFSTSHSNFSIMPNGGTVPAPISHFNIAQSNTSVMYVAKRIYHSYNQPSELWVTTNGGTNWTNRTSGLPDSLYFTYVDVDDDDPMNAWVTVAGYEAGQHVYHTTDGGVNWNNITYNLPNLPTNCIEHEDNSPYNGLYIGTDIGVYYSNDTMTTWEPYYINLPNVIVSDLNINYTDNVIYAATFGRGVWKTELVPDTSGIITGTEQAHLQNLDFNLYPNPNNGIFNIHIEGYSGNTLKLEVVNILGEIVATDELNLVEGSYQGELNYDLGAGMYFLKLTKGKQFKAIRFVVK
jgi:photosystem II stability/assembly factor-like uncharacterized protein